MPRAKKKEPKLNTVTSKQTKSVTPKVSSKNKKGDSEDQIVQEPPSRSRRAAASKTQACESLIPNSRDSAPGSPGPAKSGKNQTSEVASRPTSRARSRTAAKRPGPGTSDAQDVPKSGNEVVSSESGSGRPTRRGRSQKKDASAAVNETSKEALTAAMAVSVSAKGSSVRRGRKGKTDPQNKEDGGEGAARSVSSKGNQSNLKRKNEESTEVLVTADDRKITEPTRSDAEENVKKSTRVKGSTAKGRKEKEGPLTKVSHITLFKLGQTAPLEESILKDSAGTGKWKSFSNQNLSLKSKRLSLERKESSSDLNKKRKSSITPDELNPTPTKKPAVKPTLRKVGFQSIARSFAKNGTITQKNAPRKTLCSMDILGLLDDDLEDEADELPERPDVDEVVPDEPLEKDQQNKVVTKATNSFLKGKDKVPVWKQVKLKSGDDSKTADDVFNPEKYGEEEFGPEDLNPKKKRVRKKKKDTKAILVFGGKSKSGATAKSAVNEVKKAVKESHNLKTPEVEKKKGKKAAVDGGKRLIQPIPNIFDNPPPSSLNNQPKGPIIKVTNYSTDISHGAQNYFDSEIHHYEPGDDDHFDCPPDTGEDINRSGAFGASLSVPSKNYKTPAIPKKISRLQSDNSSTPNQKEASKPLPVTIKEQIKCAFGFDDSEDDEVVSENESLSISPVRKVTNPALEMLENESVLSSISGTNRLSSIQGSTLGANISRGHQIPIIRKPAQPKKDGPFRLNLPPPNAHSVQRQLLAQVKALKEKDKKKKIIAGKKPSRFSPRKPMHSSTMHGDPIHSSTLLDFERDVPKPKNAYEMMKEASQNPREKTKKLVKKATKNPPTLEQSSLYEDPPVDPCNLDKLSGQKSDIQKLSDKENSDINSPQKPKKPAVSRVYKRKSLNTSAAVKPSVSFDQSVPKKTPKKVTKQEKAIKQWTQLQTSHFSEVDDFDLSFS